MLFRSGAIPMQCSSLQHHRSIGGLCAAYKYVTGGTCAGFDCVTNNAAIEVVEMSRAIDLAVNEILNVQ